MAISNGVIFIWTGTNAGIPAGWERVTALDGIYPKEDYNYIGLTGGSATHSHTSPAHTHTMANHTHTITLSAGVGFKGNEDNSGNAIVYNHTHAPFTSGSASGGGLSSVTSTYSSVSNNPPYYEVIYITPTTSAGGIPNLGIGFYDKSFAGSNIGIFQGYYGCDGNNSTPDLKGKYLKGAGTGADAGGTGGSTTNVHTLTHTHSVNTHTHLSATSGPAIGNAYVNDNSGEGHILKSHTHSVSLPAQSDSISGTNPVLTTTETVEPRYKKVVYLQNRSGTPYTPVGIIGMWLGTVANIPSNFEVVTDFEARFPKSYTYSYSEIGDKGGSDTHTHSAQSHTHTSLGHTHIVGNITHTTSTYNVDASPAAVAKPETYHTVSVSTATPTYSSANTTADSANNNPPHINTAYIRYKGEKGASVLFNLL